MIDLARPKNSGDLHAHLRRPLFLFGCVSLLGLLFVTFAPRRYHSDAKVFVRLGRESVGMDPTAGAANQQAAVSFSSERASEIRSIVEMLRNRELYEHVVTELTPEVVLEWEDFELTTAAAVDGQVTGKRESDGVHWTRYPGKLFGRVTSRVVRGLGKALGFHENDVFNDAVDHLAAKLNIESSRRSTVICIAYRSPQPELSQAIVSSFVDGFLAFHPKWNRVQNSTEFFESQVVVADKELNAAHAAFAAKKNELNVASLATYPDELSKQLTALEDELMLANRQLESQRTKLTALRAENEAVDIRIVTDVQAGMPDAGRDAMRSQLYELELEERQLAARYRDNYTPLVAVRQQILAAEEVLRNTRDERSNTTRGLNPIRTETEKALALQVPEVAAWQARVRKLEEQYANLTDRLKTFNQGEIELAALKRKVDLAESNFRAYATSWEESRVDHALQNNLISNVNVVQSATLQPDAVFPRELPALLGFMLFGLIVSGAVFWYDLQKNSAIRSPGEIATAMRAPVLARFPSGHKSTEFDLTAEKP